MTAPTGRKMDQSPARKRAGKLLSTSPLSLCTLPPKRIPSSRSSDMRSPSAHQASTILSFLAVAVAILLFSGGGCARAQVYQAAELPLSLQAPVFRDPTALDLGALTPPQNKSDLIGPGYVVEISLAAGLEHDSNTTFHVRVAEDGTARLPEIGQIQLAGLEEVQAEESIAAMLVQGGLYQRPTVSVHIERRPTNSITVVGAVKNPGSQQVCRSASCLGAAIVAAGGFTEKAGTKIHITRFNREPRMVEVDLDDEKQR
ncbi:MAG: polysaccharide biosynthesis/export family protein, partial [Thermoguttaceae bacterium]